jgi:hypothetical protein
MKIFLSWSGQPSLNAAKVLEMWLPRLLQHVNPFISEEIEKGSRGLSVIADELNSTDYLNLRRLTFRISRGFTKSIFEHRTLTT